MTGPVASTPRRQSLGYQPALDGVRAAAIALVVLVHYPWHVAFLEPRPFHGGFLGVDAFFCLSGFLITTLLLEERVASGGVSLRRFYARRALRLLPALAVLLAIALVMHFTLASKDPNRPETNGLIGVALYVANWVGINRPRSLGITFDTWSLAIEEQFYVVWPLILIVVLRRRVSLAKLALVTAAGITASAAWRAWYWHHLLDHMHSVTYSGTNRLLILAAAQKNALEIHSIWQRIYFGSDTRADSLLAGCLTAILLFWLLPGINAWTRTSMGVLSWAGLLVAAVIVWRAQYVFSSWLPDWGFLVFAVAVSTVIIGVLAVPHGPLARAFGLGPLPWVGRRSYAIYLFHPLVYIWCSRKHVHLSPPLSFVFQIGVILVVAELSYRLVEAPMLRRKQHFAAHADRATEHST